jgi:hypothetical protein
MNPSNSNPAIVWVCIIQEEYEEKINMEGKKRNSKRERRFQRTLRPKEKTWTRKIIS